jgi:hypothetical protein
MKTATIDGSCLTSLDPQETNEFLPLAHTASQRIAHARWFEARCRIIRTLRSSQDDTLQDRSYRIDGCCGFPVVWQTEEGTPHVSLNACKDRLCPRCQHARAWQVRLRVLALTNRFNAPRFATLTLDHREESLAQMYARCMAGFRKLRTSPFWKSHVRAGVWVIEVTRNKTTNRWHVHVHTIIDGSFMPQKQLSATWLKATETAYVVDIRAVPDRAKAATYVAKYVGKGIDCTRWTDDEICEFATAMHGRRLVHTFGAAHAEVTDSITEREKRGPMTRVGFVHRLPAAMEAGEARAWSTFHTLTLLGPQWCVALGVDPTSLLFPAEPPDAARISNALSFLRELDARPYAQAGEPHAGRPPPTHDALLPGLAP